MGPISREKFSKEISIKWLQKIIIKQTKKRMKSLEKVQRHLYDDLELERGQRIRGKELD